jgi:eukaryotic-like serine/threonine-protein kinase
MADEKPPSSDRTVSRASPGSEQNPSSIPSFGGRETQSLHAAAVCAFLPGEILAGRFRVVRFVARGGMGEVYEAEDLELKEPVALKTARTETALGPHEVERFRREISLARKVTHPNVCRTFDVFRHVATAHDGSARETLFVSMELLSGETLEKFIRHKGRLSPAAALPIVTQMASGLSAAHQVGVIHRDFKSSNVILVAPSSGSQALRAVITDFGLAHAELPTTQTLTRPGDMVGTPAYMAPEQVEGGEITAATDIYALGIVLYEMLTGALPFSAETPLGMAMKRLSQPAPSPRVLLPDLDRNWESAVVRCLEREPAQRFASADDVVKALSGEQVIVAPRAARTLRPSWPVLLALALAIILIGAAGIAFIAGRRHAPSAPPGAAQTSRTVVAILGFTNLSGNKDSDLLGDVLADGLWSQLDTDEIRFIVPSEVDDLKRNLGLKNTTDSLTNDQISAIHKYLGAQVVIVGTYTVNGPPAQQNIQWNIHLLKTEGNENLGSVQQAGPKADLNTLVAHAGKLIRARLGVELSPAEEARMDASLSANPDAMLYFAQARDKVRDFDVLAATKLLQKAIEEDPKFAQAHTALAEAWTVLGYDSKAAEEAKKALNLASNLSSEGQVLVTARYHEAAHDWPKAIEQYSSLWSLYRDNPQYGLSLARTEISAAKAKAALTTLAEVRSQNGPAGILAQADLAEAEAQKSLAEYQAQLTAANAAAEKAKSLGASLLLARARLLQCSAYNSLGQPDQALPLCEESKTLNTTAGDQLGAANATNEIGNSLFYQGKFGQASSLYEQALGMAQAIGDKQDEAGALNNLANTNDKQGNHEGAISNYRKSIEVARDRGDLSDVAMAEQNLASDLYQDGNRVEGKEMFARAITAARDANDKSTEAFILNNQCMIGLLDGDLADARKSCEDSLRLRRSANDRAGVGRTLTNLGDVQVAQGELDAGESSYNEAVSILDAIEAKGDAAYARISLAILALAQDQAGVAAKYARDAASELAAEKDAGGEAQARGALAEALAAQGNLPSANDESAKATALAQQSDDRSTKLMLAITAAKIVARSGNSTQALNSLEAIRRQAEKAGVVAVAFEARLAAGEIENTAGSQAAGNATLRSLAKEAKARGFLLIASKASAAVHG